MRGSGSVEVHHTAEAVGVVARGVVGHVSVTLPDDAGERLTIEWMEPVSDSV